MLRLAVVLFAMGLVFGGLGNALCSEPTRNVNKFRERIETLTMWKMMEALDLDKETSNKILALRRKFETKRNELEKSINEDLHKLRSLVKTSESDAGDKELAALIDSIRGKRKQLDELRDAHFTDMSKVLSVRQQAKLILFLKEFRREIRDMIRASMRHRPPEGELRHRSGGPGGRFGPPGGEPPAPPPLPGGRWDAGPVPDDLSEGR